MLAGEDARDDDPMSLNACGAGMVRCAAGAAATGVDMPEDERVCTNMCVYNDVQHNRTDTTENENKWCIYIHTHHLETLTITTIPT